ncbi:MAG: hypothetical protein GY838_11255, partial [bacterium]|nr:hypothetical protein [bacterium]
DLTGGKDIWENLALSSIGGLTSSTVLILSAIPAVYWITTRWGWGFARVARRARSRPGDLPSDRNSQRAAADSRMHAIRPVSPGH